MLFYVVFTENRIKFRKNIHKKRKELRRNPKKYTRRDDFHTAAKKMRRKGKDPDSILKKCIESSLNYIKNVINIKK